MIEAFARELSRHEKVLVGLFLLVKLGLLLTLPLTGDEAYFIYWAERPALGYYDHPPMVGWTIYLLSFISDHYYFYRLFAFVIVFIVAALLYRLLAPEQGGGVAVLVATLFLLSPLSLIGVMLVNDLLLLLFGSLGFYCFSRSLDKGSIGLAAVTGVCLGLAFLSKYLSAPLFIGLLLYLLLNPKRGQWKLALVAIGIASLFVLENLYFNQQNCWNNVAFNLVSRTRGGGFNAGYVALFIVCLALVAPPPALVRLAAARGMNITPLIKQAFYVTACFLVIFLLVSSFKRIGLHWLYLPVVFLYLVMCILPEERLRFYLKYNGVLSIALGLLLIGLITQMDRLFADKEDYREALVYTQPETICEALPAGQTVFTLGYSQNSVLSYHCKANAFHVFANTSKYGREDDKRIDWRDHDGATMTVLLTDLADREKIAPYFSSTETRAIPMARGIDYYLVTGKGFSFEKYLPVIETIDRLFYNAPGWLPAARCDFKGRYFR